MDGYDAESYSILRKVDTNENNTPKNIFDRIIENILYAVEIGLNVSINYTITAATIGNFYKTFEFINGLGIKRMLGIKFFPFGQGEKYASELELDYEVWKAFLIDLFERKKQNDKYKGIKISVPCPWELYLPFYENQENLHEIETYFSYNSPLESQAYSKMRNIGCHAGITSCAMSANGDVYPCGTVSSKFPPFVCFFVLNMVILYKTAFGKSMDFCLIQHVLFSFFTFFHLFVQFSLFLFRCSYKIDTRNLPEERS